MDIVKLLSEAEANGVSVEVIDGKLIIGTPASKKSWNKKLRAHEDAILAHLNGEAPDVGAEPVVTAYAPFPVAAFPEAVARYIEAASAAIGCDPSFVALPLLTCLARAVGNTRTIRLKRTWCEPAVVWAAIVGPSGSHKTPALGAAMTFLHQRESEAFKKHAEAAEKHEQELACYERDMAAWRKLKNSSEPPPWKPEPPTCERFITSDATIEALACLLDGQFDGVLVYRDELAGWLGGIAEYKGGKGSDLGHWLACWSAAPLTVDRKTGSIRHLRIPRAAVSLVGGVQPGVLRSAIGREHLQDGLCARLLLAMPDPRPVRWSEATVPPDVEAAMGVVFDNLLSMEPAADAEGEPEPYPLDMTPEAKRVWVAYFDRHRAELADLDDDLAAAWSKLEAYCARFALIFQLCEWASGNAPGDEIDEAAMRAGIELSDWFGAEAKRVYRLFSETDDDREVRELVAWIQRRGGEVTVRDLTRGPQKYRGDSAAAESALNKLVALGLGAWHIEATATVQKRVFRLATVATATDSPISRDLRESVAVASGDSPATHSTNGEAPSP